MLKGGPLFLFTLFLLISFGFYPQEIFAVKNNSTTVTASVSTSITYRLNNLNIETEANYKNNLFISEKVKDNSKYYEISASF